MEFSHQFEEDSGWHAFHRLSQRGDLLASRLIAALPGNNPAGDVDLYPVLQECTTLKEDVDEYYSIMKMQNPTLRYLAETLRGKVAYNSGHCFGRLQNLINPQQLAWDVRVKSTSWAELLACDLDIEDYYQHESTEMFHVHCLLRSLMTNLRSCWSPFVSGEMVLTNRSTMESYHVLRAKWTKELSNANAVEGPGGDVYIRIGACNAAQFSAPRLLIYCMHQKGYTFLNLPSVNISEATEESTAKSGGTAEYEGRIDHLTRVLQGNGISAQAAAPCSSSFTSTSAGSSETTEESNTIGVRIAQLEELVDHLLQENSASTQAAAPSSSSPTSTSDSSPETTEASEARGRGIAELEARIDHLTRRFHGYGASKHTVTRTLPEGLIEMEMPNFYQTLQDQPPHTTRYSSARQLPLTSHREAVVVEPTEALQVGTALTAQHTPTQPLPVLSLSPELIRDVVRRQLEHRSIPDTNHQHDFLFSLVHNATLEALGLISPSPTPITKTNADIGVYGFSRDVFFQENIPSASVHIVPQGLLPQENRAWAAPVSTTSPEADSPWSETQGPAPPYALSPGIYQLRLEAATRPSPDAQSPDPVTPAPPYALSPGVFHRYGDDF